MEGCKATAKAFATSLALAVAAGGTAGNCGQHGHTPRQGSIVLLRAPFLFTCWKAVGSLPTENDHRPLHSVSHTTIA